MKISEFIAAVGDDVVSCQWLDDCMTGISLSAKSGTKVTFGTDVRLSGNCDQLEKFGVVIWAPRDKVEQVLKAVRERQPKEPNRG